METYAVTVYLACDPANAKAWLRRECYESGMCVTVTPTSFLYTGGEEVGVAIGFVNYPRYPADPPAIFARALRIARELVVECCQKSALVVATDRTEWVRVEPPGGLPACS